MREKRRKKKWKEMGPNLIISLIGERNEKKEGKSIQKPWKKKKKKRRKNVTRA
jgi:hypothetical protein